MRICATLESTEFGVHNLLLQMTDMVTGFVASLPNSSECALRLTLQMWVLRHQRPSPIEWQMLKLDSDAVKVLKTVTRKQESP